MTLYKLKKNIHFAFEMPFDVHQPNANVIKANENEIKKSFSGCSLIEDFVKAEIQISFAILLLF